MKTIEEIAKAITDNALNCDRYNSMSAMCLDISRKSITSSQRWIPIEEELPEKLSTDCNQANGNTLTFFENYLVKGYWNNPAKSKDIRMATYRIYSIGWYFRVHKYPNTVDFIITHWRPIELK